MHSKGPWRIGVRCWCEGSIGFELLSADNRRIGFVESLEDATLAAAAPEMLSALKAVLEIYDEPCRLDHHGLCQTHHLRRNDAGEPECEVELIRAAIAAASGAAKEEGTQ